MLVSLRVEPLKFLFFLLKEVIHHLESHEQLLLIPLKELFPDYFESLFVCVRCSCQRISIRSWQACNWTNRRVIFVIIVFALHYRLYEKALIPALQLVLIEQLNTDIRSPSVLSIE